MLTLLDLESGGKRRLQSTTRDDLLASAMRLYSIVSLLHNCDSPPYRTTLDLRFVDRG